MQQQDPPGDEKEADDDDAAQLLQAKERRGECVGEAAVGDVTNAAAWGPGVRKTMLAVAMSTA